MKIRKIEPQDNAQIAKVIRDIFDELDAPKEGTAYADPILDTLFEVYQKPKSVYYVVEKEGSVVGGCGIAPLELSLRAESRSQQDNNEICELQKMYFAPEIRGTGLAQQIIEMCLEFAQSQGFQKCYLETLPFMQAAQKLYARLGFQYLDQPLGCTGHTSCDVWMIKEL